MQLSLISGSAEPLGSSHPWEVRSHYQGRWLAVGRDLDVRGLEMLRMERNPNFHVSHVNGVNDRKLFRLTNQWSE